MICPLSGALATSPPGIRHAGNIIERQIVAIILGFISSAEKEMSCV
jgi:hypothetical protein